MTSGLTEHICFEDVACVNCGAKFSVKVDTWLVSVRQNLLQSTQLSPTMFSCEQCGAVNQIEVAVSVKVRTKAPDGGGAKDQAPVVSMGDFRRKT